MCEPLKRVPRHLSILWSDSCQSGCVSGKKIVWESVKGFFHITCSPSGTQIINLALNVSKPVHHQLAT
jgi:hypothetical protein